MQAQSWREALADRIPPEFGAEIDLFEAQIELRLRQCFVVQRSLIVCGAVQRATVSEHQLVKLTRTHVFRTLEHHVFE